MVRPSESARAGFTLLETLFVVAVLGVLVALALPAYQNVLTERRVQNVAREVAADLRVAQQAAVAKSAEAKCVGVAFLSNRVAVYVVPQDASFNCSTPTASALEAYGVLMTSQDYPLGVAVSPSPGDAVAFLPSGSPYPTCRTSGCTGFRATVSSGAHSRAVCVGAAGLVSVPSPGEGCP
ncbi:hypothetical protein HRbin32_02113 [bacterium HR32]|nr:hypothetical protein HRbin32_02113 [bacterium HR32]